MSKEQYITRKPIYNKDSVKYAQEVQFIRIRMCRLSWSIKDAGHIYLFPHWLLEKVYSKIDGVIKLAFDINSKEEVYYTSEVRVAYIYIPKEYTIDKIPIIIDVQLEEKAPENAVFMSYRELKEVFKNNKFKD